MCGAVSQKPTHLLHVHSNVHHLVDALPNHGLCDRSHQHVSLIGRDADGGFLTGPSKQYPSDMNLLLATSAVDAALIASVEPGPPDFEGFDDTLLARFFVPLDSYLEDHTTGRFGADFSSQSGTPDASWSYTAASKFIDTKLQSAVDAAVCAQSAVLQASHLSRVDPDTSTSDAFTSSACRHLKYW